MVEKELRTDDNVPIDISLGKEKVDEEKIDISLDNGIDNNNLDRIPTLYDIHKSFDVIKVKNHDGIKGEYLARMVVFTNFVLGRKPLVLTGPRAAGKTCIMRVITSYCSNSGEITAASEKADYRDMDLNKFDYFIIPEINKVSVAFTETLKDMGEGEPSIYKTLDAYKTPVTYKIDPKPFISSIADENKNILGEELVSRITSVRVDSSMDQNIGVIKYKLERAQNPFVRREVTQKEILGYRKYVKELPNLKNYTFIYLPGKSVLNAIPPFFTDSRRDVDKYLANTFGIALFHLHDRMIVERKKKKLFLITPADAWYNHVIFNDVIVQSSLKCSGIEKVILDILGTTKDSEGNLIKLTYKEIHSILVKKGYTPNLGTIRKYCRNLFENGYLIRHDDTKPFKYESSGFLKDYMAKIDWKEVISECKRAVIDQFDKETAETYVRKYCDEPVLVKNPFTGEQINLFEYEEKIEIKKEEVIEIIKPKKEKKSESLEDFEEEKIELPKMFEEDIATEETLEDDEEESEEENNKDEMKTPEQFILDNSDGKGLVDAHLFEDYFGYEQTEKYLKEGIIFENKPGKYHLI